MALLLSLTAAPALAQQSGGGSTILDTLNRALNQPGTQSGRSSGDDYRRSTQQDDNLPRDRNGNVDISRLNDNDLVQYNDTLERRGRYLASELRDTQQEIQRRGLDGGSNRGSGSSGGRHDSGRSTR
jgi:hypothetical protein